MLCKVEDPVLFSSAECLAKGADLRSMRKRRPPYIMNPAAATRDTMAMKQQDKMRGIPFVSFPEMPVKIQRAICMHDKYSIEEQHPSAS